MPSDEIERSGSGSPIYRHKARESGWQPPENPAEYLQEIEDHVEKHIGKIETVFHELVSDLVHLDVLFVPGTQDRPYHTLITSGVSDLPMKVPEGLEEYRRAELLIALPLDWPLTQESFNEEANYWPIRWLKMVGRLPHEYQSWVGWGHTVPNGDPAEPIANTNFTGVILLPPYWLSPEFFRLTTSSDEPICFYNIVPLYQEELDFKLRKGAEELENQLAKTNYPFVLDVKRKNAAKKRGWLW